MRNTFCGFYSLNNEDSIKDVWKSKKTVFIFDTNCLLNLYRCEDKTRDDILSVMSRISHNIWLPFFVCLEYQKNRRTVITESINSLNQISKSLDAVVNSVTDSLGAGRVKKHLYNSLSDGVHSLQGEIKPLVDKFIKEHIDPRINSKEKINKKDIIRDQIDKLVTDRCGSPPTKEWISEINIKGDYRYNNSIPPGFLDSGKKDKKIYQDLEFEEKYGDLYIWMEILEKCKDDNIENVVFICDDNKKDWWYEKQGITHGPLESLQTEIYSVSKVKNFKLLNQASFLRDAQKYLSNINIDSESLKEVQDISEYLSKSPIQRLAGEVDYTIKSEKMMFDKVNTDSLLSETEVYYDANSESAGYLTALQSTTQLKALDAELLKCFSKLSSVRNRCLVSNFDIERLPGELSRGMDDLRDELYFYKKRVSKYLDLPSQPSNSRMLVVTRRFINDVKKAISRCNELVESIDFYLDIV